MTRTASIERKTRETEIHLQLDLDTAPEAASIRTPVGFFTHMMEAFAKHSGFGLTLSVEGDVHVDDHHSVEDTGICLGQAFQEAAADKSGMARFGWAVIPMDESLVEVSVDFGGRPCFVMNGFEITGKVGSFDVELVREFFAAVAASADMNLHINVRYGTNKHHIIEACFKAFAHACRQALARNRDGVLSTKGVL
ncbi:imidazoleglycerol-phosphate dehydratase HisB [Desulfurispirillum indicum]|uniref:imidazoleglycerol-phosphate dehydratase HisB n=1 Tax=Desulfurispirillum indicum TaxID=936456 RepID=UPI001CFA8159|nr:imidazoleglycerol-phosphate dehydratase HisB [Desulfurispirillum indicum]UCZ55922.1 imidazoleglycerol-phosphate dehydratase HisB [Desulfurispirillum indicum]